MILELDPSACKMWYMHERLGDGLSTESCAALIHSMRTHGLKNPVLGRRVASDGPCQVELIYGARRLFAAQQLGMKLLVRLCDLDDRAALIEMDIENRMRRDITPYERGLSYRRWLSAGIFRSQAEIAKALAISVAQISRLLNYAELPAVVVGAFGSVDQIREEWAVELARCCRDPATRQNVLQSARACARSRSTKRPHTVYQLLSNNRSRRPIARKVRDEVIKDSEGNPLLRIGYRSKTIHLILPRDKFSREVLLDIASELEKIMSHDVERAADRRDVRSVVRLAPGSEHTMAFHPIAAPLGAGG
jgi:ParB/RepB/Spo0J family partition protein